MDIDTRLLESVTSGDLNAVKQCVESIADINAVNKDDETALMVASKMGYLEIVKYLVDNDFEVNARVTFGNETALILASQYGHLEIVNFLISRGAEKNAQDYFGFTALMWASVRGYFKIVQCLVECGANANIINRDGWSALEMSKTDEIWEYLSQTTDNINNNHALINFAINGNLEKIKYFLEQGANINATSSCGCTSLMLASKYRYLDILKYLVESGADINIRDRYGKTALNYSRADEIREFLKHNGATK